MHCHDSPRRFSRVAIELAVNWLALLHLVRDPAGHHHDCAVEWAADLVESTRRLLVKLLLTELAVFVHQQCCRSEACARLPSGSDVRSGALVFDWSQEGPCKLRVGPFPASAVFSSANQNDVYVMWKRRHRVVESESAFSTDCGVVRNVNVQPSTLTSGPGFPGWICHGPP